MKRIVYLACIGSLALVLTAWGAPREKGGHASARSGSAHVVSHKSGGGHTVARADRAPRTSHVGTARARTHVSQHRTVSRNRATVGDQRKVAGSAAARTGGADAARTRSSQVAKGKASDAERNRTTLNRERNLARANGRTNRGQAAQAGNERIAKATRNAAQRNLTVNRKRNLNLARNVLHNRAGNIRVTNNWRNARFNNARYAAFHNYNRTWHDRGWWRNHHSNIVFVLGGWWYWNTGYWYPAWGYDPYGWYAYDGPIYTGYANITPDQVIINVQVALQDQGYYAGAIDGAIGPQTRAALAAFQADNGLAVTSAVDQPTLETLGVA